MLSFLFVLSSGFRPMLNELKAILSQEFSSIQEEFLVYDNFESILAPFQEKQNSYDSVLFAGDTIYRFVRTRVRQTTHWTTFPRSSNNVLRAITEAALYGIDITRLSIDSYSNHAIFEAYREIGIPPEKLKLQIYNDTEDELFLQKALRHHLKFLQEKTVSGCITASTYVVQEMRKRDLPYAPLLPTLDTMRNTISSAIQYHQAQENTLAQIAVIYININFPPEYSLLLSDEYSFRLQKMSIAKEIYKYADRISASVAEESLYNFILFSTRGALELETDHFRKFELLGWLRSATGYSISIGLGNGETAQEARNNAFRAMLKAKRHPENAAYVILNNGEPVGPYLCDEVDHSDDAPRDELQSVNRQTGISTNTLHRLYTWVQKNNVVYFTSKELAEGLKINRRSADRLVEKLIAAGLADSVDAQMSGIRGRPARVIHLRLPQLDK